MTRRRSSTITNTNPEGVEERTSIYVIDRDLGNVAYSSWIKSVLDQALGDVVEMILGFFEVMSYFPRTSIVERRMEDQEGVRAFHRAAPRREEPKAEQAVCAARSARKGGDGHHEHGQAQTSAIPGERAGQPRAQEKRLRVKVVLSKLSAQRGERGEEAARD